MRAFCYPSICHNFSILITYQNQYVLKFAKRKVSMENAYMLEAEFVDRRTIRLTEEYPFIARGIRLIIIPEKPLPKRRKAGILKGKIRMSGDFDEPLEDMKEYME